MSEVFAWQVFEDDKWGAIAAYVPGFGMVPLYARKRRTADSFRGLAEAHAMTTRLPVRLARFEFAEVEEELHG